MNKPLLSICIPTYSRAHYLKECLDSIVSQFGDPEVYQSVEIIISDNASPDNTREVVEEYRKKFNNIKYFRNNENLGADRNVLNVVERASGEYGWYMGDDDVMGSESLRFVIDYLKKHEVAVFTFRSAPLKEISNFAGVKIPNDVAIFLNSPDEFFLKNYCLGIFSVLGFKRSLWLTVVDRDEIAWLYLRTVMKIMPLARKLGFVYFNYPMVFTLQNDSERVKNGGELVYWIPLIRLFKKMKGFGYEQKTMDTAIKFHAKSLPLILCRAKGHDLDSSWRNLHLLWREFYSSPFYLRFYLYVATLIFFVPNNIIKIIRDLRKKIYAIK